MNDNDDLVKLFHATGTRTASDITDEERQREIDEWDRRRELEEQGRQGCKEGGSDAP